MQFIIIASCMIGICLDVIMRFSKRPQCKNSKPAPTVQLDFYTEPKDFKFHITMKQG